MEHDRTVPDMRGRVAALPEMPSMALDQRQVGQVEQELAAAREVGDAMPLMGDAVGITHRQCTGVN